MAAARPRIVLASNQRPGFRVAFSWQGDRYTHQIQLDNGSQSLLLDTAPSPPATTPDESWGDNWPQDPPLQQVTIENQAAGPVALGVGMAGSSHWSASVELLDHPPRVRLDLACLARELPERLGSRYWLSRPAQVTEGCPQLQWHIGDQRVLLTSQADAVRQTQLRLSAGRLEIFPAVPSDFRPPQTIRWGFELRLWSPAP